LALGDDDDHNGSFSLPRGGRAVTRAATIGAAREKRRHVAAAPPPPSPRAVVVRDTVAG
jgi:hypothetical protein